MDTSTQVELVTEPTTSSFQMPSGQVPATGGQALQANVSSIVNVVGATFLFRENSNTPGRVLEQSQVVNVPAGAGFFTGINGIDGAFTTSDFTHLTERPLGEFSAFVGLRGNNLVCTVRLTDSNSDDPIQIVVRGFIAFFA
jgi:hypothetical protein